MTDDTGILQHARSSIGDRREGYTTDDNARALLATLRYHELLDGEKNLGLVRTYLSFLLYVQKKDGRLHNIVGYDHIFLDEVGSDDSLGRALWACGYSQDTSIPEDVRIAAKEIFDRSLIWALKSSSPRTKAFAILGLYHYVKAYPGDKNPQLNVIHLADQLCELYRQASTPTWQWFEPYVTYANPRLSHALFRAYQTTGKKDYLHIAEKTLNFLAANDIVKGIYQPVGNQSWYERGGKKALYDQQPLEASCMVEAASVAFQVTGKKMYAKMARIAFAWFLGENSNGVLVYNPDTGGTYDGISARGLNRNQGAESGLSYLLARFEMEILHTHELQSSLK
ncbi:MAG: D-glucuronyl C5-epimerase family protein [Promethearchaeota archaeon]